MTAQTDPRTLTLIKIRQRAMKRLKDQHPEEFLVILNEERAKEGLAPVDRVRQRAGGRSRNPKVSDLMTIAQIAELAGVGHQAVANWLKRPVGFPEHAIVLGDVRAWDKRQVIAWLKKTKRYPDN